MEFMLSIISIFSVCNFALKSAEFFSDEQNIQKQTTRIKNVYKNVTFNPKIKQMYKCIPYEDDGIIIEVYDWVLIDK